MNKYWLLMNHLQQKNQGEDFSDRPEWQDAVAEAEAQQEMGWGEWIVQGLAGLFAPAGDVAPLMETKIVRDLAE
ncbi:MAG: hypothetical protein KA314_06590 [Chloroflexi bacterium]|nr:hypothetical protein [Chloroflexota bacterium]MBP8055492.1 hypothetical protein [Chloroflexota bacterium]